MATFEDFLKVEIRVGRILEVREFPEARKPAYKLLIDFGKYGLKNSSAQITERYKPENLKGKLIIAVTNFPPKIIAGFKSEVLVLGVVGDDGDVVLIGPDFEVDLGLRIL